jgi:hypothetical protein
MQHKRNRCSSSARPTWRSWARSTCISIIAPIGRSTLDGDLQVVLKSGLREIYPFSFRYVDPGQDGSDSINLNDLASVDPPARVIVRSIDVCQLGGKYYRGCAAGMAGGMDAMDALPVSIDVPGGR